MSPNPLFSSALLLFPSPRAPPPAPENRAPKSVHSVRFKRTNKMYNTKKLRGKPLHTGEMSSVANDTLRFHKASGVQIVAPSHKLHAV